LPRPPLPFPYTTLFRSHTPGDKQWVFPGADHARQIIQRGIDIAGTHTLDIGADGIVMFLAGFVVTQMPRLQGVFDMLNGDLPLRSEEHTSALQSRANLV